MLDVLKYESFDVAEYVGVSLMGGGCHVGEIAVIGIIVNGGGLGGQDEGYSQEAFDPFDELISSMGLAAEMVSNPVHLEFESTLAFSASRSRSVFVVRGV